MLTDIDHRTIQRENTSSQSQSLGVCASEYILRIDSAALDCFVYGFERPNQWKESISPKSAERLYGQAHAANEIEIFSLFAAFVLAFVDTFRRIEYMAKH